MLDPRQHLAFCSPLKESLRITTRGTFLLHLKEEVRQGAENRNHQNSAMQNPEQQQKIIRPDIVAYSQLELGSFLLTLELLYLQLCLGALLLTIRAILLTILAFLLKIELLHTVGKCMQSAP